MVISIWVCVSFSQENNLDTKNDELSILYQEYINYRTKNNRFNPEHEQEWASSFIDLLKKNQILP
jgi:hypothetical protein